MARVLVTGGAGFIGSHTVARLVTAGHQVTVYDNLVSGSWANLAAVGDAVARITGDVRDSDALGRVARARPYDALIHLAALASPLVSIQQPLVAHGVNVGGALHALEAARQAGVGRVVFASSAAIYGGAPALPCREDALPAPLSPYAAHKAAGELLCAAYRAAYGLAAVPLRFFNVYGLRQPFDSPYSGFIAIALDRARCGQPLTIFGDGEQTRDFVHVSDVAAAVCRAALGPDPGGEPINVATGQQLSLRAVVATLEAAHGQALPLRFAPARPGDVRHSVADVTRLRERLGLSARVGFAVGLRELIAARPGDAPT